MKSKLVLACAGLCVVVSAALPAFAESGLLSLGAGSAGAGSTAAAPAIGFLKIAPSDGQMSPAPSGFNRFDTSLVPSLEPYASFKPWLGTERTASRNSFSVGGFLVDVPLGDFVFTPSFGGGRYTENNGRDQTSALQFRSALALGYSFDGQSRLSLDYSHTTATAQTLGGPVSGNALAFTVRVPSTWLLGQ